MTTVTKTAIEGVLVFEPKVFGDARGFFFESFNERAFREATGLDAHFVQDNHSRSAKGVLRGLHYQLQQPQGASRVARMDRCIARAPEREGNQVCQDAVIIYNKYFHGSLTGASGMENQIQAPF